MPINLELTSTEKVVLKQKGVTLKSLPDYAIDEIIVMLNAQPHRAKVLQALFEFQQIPSVGIRFAYDLMSIGYYRLEELKDKNGAALLDEYERKAGFRVDPCVEDQFRLVVYHSNHPDSKKQWWDFTNERKVYRQENGYPPDRP